MHFSCPSGLAHRSPSSRQARRHRSAERSLTRSAAATSVFFCPASKRSMAWIRNRFRAALPASVSPPPCAYLIRPGLPMPCADCQTNSADITRSSSVARSPGGVDRHIPCRRAHRTPDRDRQKPGSSHSGTLSTPGNRPPSGQVRRPYLRPDPAAPSAPVPGPRTSRSCSRAGRGRTAVPRSARPPPRAARPGSPSAA